ncbi:MAG: hypothetical protein C4519_06700 [Desulfobacteraceae bacterium]|nr:MAG: hypothetical protein C4519_06700 [Desulfobacteraceae bacterium]
MKKFVIALIVLLLVPFNAMALQTLDEGDMGAITGQAGVHIAVDDVMIFQNIASLTYTDEDGTSVAALAHTDTGAGSVSLSNLRMMVNINGITSLDATTGTPVSPGRAALFTGYADAIADGFSFANGTGPLAGAFIAKAITIDVGKMDVLSAGLVNNAVYIPSLAGETTMAGVRIGLPTVEVHQTELSFDITVDYTPDAGADPAYNTGDSFGNLKIGQNTMLVLDGFLEIAPHH